MLKKRLLECTFLCIILRLVDDNFVNSHPIKVDDINLLMRIFANNSKYEECRRRNEQMERFAAIVR